VTKSQWTKICIQSIVGTWQEIPSFKPRVLKIQYTEDSVRVISIFCATYAIEHGLRKFRTLADFRDPILEKFHVDYDQILSAQLSFDVIMELASFLQVSPGRI
jgi:hypothetical protein